MKITTQDCKDFIFSISKIIHAKKSDIWTRTRKYKDGDFVLRDFKNQDGRVVIIAQSMGTSELFLYQLTGDLTQENKQEESSDVQNVPGRKQFSQSVTHQDVFQFMAQCVEQDSSIVYDEADDMASAIDPKSWVIFESWTKGVKFSKENEHPLSQFFNDNDGSCGEFDLYYPDEDGQTLQINKEDIVAVFWVGMSDYDTAYRIYVFETYDHQLWLGVNNPD